MRFNKRRLAVAVILFLIVLQLQPVFHIADASPVQIEQSFAVKSPVSSQGTSYVSVFIPAGDSIASGILSAFLSSHGLNITSYGLLSSFKMPRNDTQVTGELNMLEQSFGIKYYISSNNTLAFPSNFGSAVLPAQQTANEYVPSQIRTAYNFTYPLTHKVTGKGTTIALVDAYGDPNIRYDVNAFDNATGLPPTNLSIVYPNNFHTSQYNRSWAIETSTDVEWAHALAPGAKIVLVIAQNASVPSLDYAVSYVVSHHLANIISLSWGIPESELGNKELSTFSGVYKYAAESGITVLAATGDYGAFDQQKTLTVNFPSSDPYVVAVGGTSLYPSGNGFEQSAWGGNLSGSSYGSGGGYSSYFSTPWWQSAPGFSSGSRGTPDVSMNANKNTGMLVISQAKEYKIGGTSIATPMWADVVSLMDQSLNRSLGMVDPLLYQIARSPMYQSSFYDITSGDNGWYKAAPGWDAVTGLGTPKVSSLLNATMNLSSSYGDVALINGTGYNSSGIQTMLSLTGSPASETFNGSTFYYIGSYYNQQNYMKFGIMVNNTTISSGYEASQNGIMYESFSPIGTFTSGTHTYNLSLQYLSGSRVAMSVNGKVTTADLFLENYGRSRLSFGAQQSMSETNLTHIPSASFNDVKLFMNGTYSPPEQVYQEHYSPSGFPQLSSIQISNSSGTNFSAAYSKNAKDGVLISYSGDATAVAYTLTYASQPEGTFTLINNPATSITPTWKVNGTSITGNTYRFTSGGEYNVTATYGLSSSTITRMINIPYMKEINVTASSTLSYYGSPKYGLTVNHFYQFSGTGKLTAPSFRGSNNITVSSEGFFTDNHTMTGGSSYSTTMKARNVTLSVFVSPGNSTVTFNGKIIANQQGYHTASLSPNTTHVSISNPGYAARSYDVNLMPGKNMVSQELLKPENTSGMAVLNGNVSDAIYKFSLGGANVSVSKGGYTYTNSTGYFVLYLKPGDYNLSFSRPLYKEKYVNLNITSATSTQLNVFLSPKNINGSVPTISITREFPLLFYFGYISWSKYSGGDFAAYRVYIANNPSMSGYRSVTVTNQNTTFAFVTGIIPGKDYYVAVSVYLKDGELYSTNPVHMGYSNPFVILANLAILVGIVAYGVMAVRYVGKIRKKREMKL